MPGRYAYTGVIYHDAGAQAIVEPWSIHELRRYACPGGNPAGSYSLPKESDASAEMARFFFQHPQGGADGASEPG